MKRNQAAKLRSVTKERQRDLRMNVVRAPFPVHDNFRLGGRNPIALDELKRGIGARRKPIRRRLRFSFRQEIFDRLPTATPKKEET